jgi:hypothetical protein
MSSARTPLHRVAFLAALRALPAAFRSLPFSSPPAPRASVPRRPDAFPDCRLARPLSSSTLPLTRCARSPMSSPFLAKLLVVTASYPATSRSKRPGAYTDVLLEQCPDRPGHPRDNPRARRTGVCGRSVLIGVRSAIHRQRTLLRTSGRAPTMRGCEVVFDLPEPRANRERRNRDAVIGVEAVRRTDQADAGAEQGRAWARGGWTERQASLRATHQIARRDLRGSAAV